MLFCSNILNSDDFSSSRNFFLYFKKMFGPNLYQAKSGVISPNRINARTDTIVTREAAPLLSDGATKYILT